MSPAAAVEIPDVLRSVREEVVEAGYDLVLGSVCCMCGARGRPLCRSCERRLPDKPRSAWPTPAPRGLVRPVTVGDYAGELHDLVLAHKEHGQLTLARPLGRLLAAAAGEWGAPGERLDLVPVPSHPSVVRGRGHDPLLRVTRHAAGVLRRQGVRARVVRVLALTGRPQDQAGLGHAARAANLRDRFRAVRHGNGQAVVLVDDVITTGATLREAQRALEDAGFFVRGAATVAATRRRGPVRAIDRRGRGISVGTWSPSGSVVAPGVPALGKPMPVAGKTAHVRRKVAAVRGGRRPGPAGTVDHGAA